MGGGEDREDGQRAGSRQLLEIRRPPIDGRSAVLQPGEDSADSSWRWRNTKICTESVRTVSRISKLTGVLEIGQPPYSPDLAPTDFSLLRETKTALKRF